MAEQPKFHDQVVEGEPRDAATVVLVRDANAGGLEIFMLRRGGSSTVMHDAYVFPGGKVDDEDEEPGQWQHYAVGEHPELRLGEPDLPRARAAALFVAACRETEEEAGVGLRAADLLPLSRWITPKVPAMMRRRFDTRFFVACLPEGADPTHDGQETDASAWFTPRSALENYRAGEIMLAPPQIMTLAGLARWADCAAMIAGLRGQVPRLVEPKALPRAEGRMMVYPGHPQHPVKELAIPGPTSLVTRDGRFEPEEGFEAFFV
ncbi:MAG: NUDIX hydrolase [Burkholderiaceae bacterium]